MASSGTNGTKAEILGTYAAQLGGIGTLPGGYKMKIDESATPVVLPPRRVPYMLKDKVKAELCRMEEMGIITKVGKPTEWVNPIVVVGKPNGDVCICLDPVDLTKAVKREHFPLKRVEEVAASMSAEKVSQPLILRQDSIRSSWLKKVLGLLCSTHPLAINFGLVSAPEFFQRAMSEMFEDRYC